MSSFTTNGRPEDKEETARLQALSKHFAELRALQSAERNREAAKASDTEPNLAST